MRKLDTHRCLLPLEPDGTQKGIGFNELVMIEAVDEVPEDEANAKYAFAVKAHGVWSSAGRVEFQRGPLREKPLGQKEWRDVPPKGISNEALLAVVLDRLEAFQRGPFKCLENEQASKCIIEGLEWLKRRTYARVDRKVEGTHQP